MSGSRPKPAEAHFAEQHLGDRLSALALRRVRERFAWPAVARATVEQYRLAIELFHAGSPPC